MALSKEEVRLQCVNVACSVLGVYGGAMGYTSSEGKSDRSSADAVVDAAKTLYSWVSEGKED